MATQANITSLDALEHFRSSLIIFIKKAHNAIDGVSEDIRRTRTWVQSDQRVHWENEVKKRRRAYDQAQQDMLAAKLSSMRDDLTLPMSIVRKTKAAIEEAEDKLRKVKHWGRNYEAAIDPGSKRLESLRQILDGDMKDAVTLLVQIQKTLGGYADLGVFTESGASPKTEESAEDSKPEAESEHPAQ
ncbi:MAG: hypothetical protein ABI443_12255 [Chthoniobacterales bacterium]